MTSIRFQDRQLVLEDGETVLECLLRNGVERPSSCRSGVCQSCIMRCGQGAVPKKSQEGLKPAWKERGLFLPCVCVPTEDLVIDESDAVPIVEGRIADVAQLAPDVLQVWLQADAELAALPGQFVSLVRPADGLTRPYSVAGRDAEGRLELHVAVLPGGQMSNWLRDAAGQPVQVRGPSGECYFQADSPEQPILLAGTGTGLAPLLGVVREAIAAGHRGPMYLYHGSPRASGLYFADGLRALSETHASLSVTLSVLHNDTAAADVRVDAIDRAIAADLPKLDGFVVYLCGNPELVQLLKKKAFLAGANLPQIHSDPFVTSAPGQ